MINKKSERIKTYWALIRQFYYKYFFTDEKLIEKQFQENLGRKLELRKPLKFNDKIQWLKLNWYDSLAVKCADKYTVRKFIEEKIGSEYLNELFGVYESVEEIDIEKLPNEFVLKGTHGSGFNIICKDKENINWEKAKKRMKRWMKLNYFWRTREWVYKEIKPRIICEKYIEQVDTEELRDYKFFCFNGVPKLIQVDFNRFTNHKRNIYDLDWNFQEVEIGYPNDKNHQIEKPSNLNKMLELSSVLSKDFPHARVDFYNVDDNIIFGEITFFHGSGIEKIKPKEFEIVMGNWLQLPR